MATLLTTAMNEYKRKKNGGWKEERKMLWVVEQGNTRVMQSGRLNYQVIQLWVSQLLCIFEAVATIWGNLWQIITRNLRLFFKNQRNYPPVRKGASNSFVSSLCITNNNIKGLTISIVPQNCLGRINRNTFRICLGPWNIRSLSFLFLQVNVLIQ